MAFAAGAMVFPGGRVEAEDERLAADIAPGLEHGAARVTAIRETIEETGIAAGFVVQPQLAAVAKLRAGLAQGERLSDLLAQFDLALDLNALTPFARWCPNFAETRCFDTLFFLAEAADDAPNPEPDRKEAAHSLWASARDVLEQADAGRARLVFPTRRSLERLAQFKSLAEMLADARLHPIDRITPWIEERQRQQWLCIPEGIGYPVTAELLETARRS